MAKVKSKNISINTNGLLPTLSICMIVKDCAKELDRLLLSIHKAIDEIVIVDTGSTDDTLSVITKYQEFGCDIKFIDFTKHSKFGFVKYTHNEKEHKVINDFSIARNESLKYATKDYILWLDADDIMEKQEIMKLKFHLVKNPNTGVFLVVVDQRPDRDFRFQQLRVVPNHLGITFKGKVHEQLSESVLSKGLKYSYSNTTIFHLGYRTNEQVEKKLERNVALSLLEFKKNPSFMVNVNLAKSFIGLNKVDEAEKYIDNAIDILRKNIEKVDTESAFLAFMSKSTILGMKCRGGEAVKLLEDERDKFNEKEIFRLTVGDLYFQLKNYERAYKDLIILKKGSLNIGTIPIDVENLARILLEKLLYSAIYVGDDATVEYCVRIFIKDNNFTVPRRK